MTRLEKGELDELRFKIYTKNSNNTSIINTDYIVNSTWQNIEFLNDQIGIRMIPGARTNRLKCLLVVSSQRNY